MAVLQCLNRSKSSSDPVTPESIPKRQRELDSSMEDVIPPTKAIRKNSPTYLIVTNFYYTNKQYVKIKLMQNETNLCSSFLVKTKYRYNFDLKV